MDALGQAVVDGATPEQLERLDVPSEYYAAHLHRDDVDMFRGVADKDVRKSLRLGRVPMPELAPDEVLVAVMASAVNFNTVWSAIFEPLPTFQFLKSMGRRGKWEARHDQPYQVVGSDAAGVVVAMGDGVRGGWRIGDHVVVSPGYVDDQDPEAQNDSIKSGTLAWGFETNFGAFAHYCVVRASMLMRKPAHLSWEEAACNPLCAGTAYRMLVSEHSARMKQGDVVLIWGATGGLGAYGVQFVKNGGGIAVGVVSSAAKEELARKLGCDVVINREELGMAGYNGDDPARTVEIGRRLGKMIRTQVGEDPDIVYDYVGQKTFAISVFVAKTAGTVVTCGSSTGYQHQFDNRYLWMRVKRIVGSHGANMKEQLDCNRLINRGQILPTLSTVYPLDEVPEAVRLVQTNGHAGKVGVLCLSPEEGLGITDPALRARIGEDRINLFRHAA
ncbi:crotonyl-CoA carboxylase/reductase [Actinophytocola xanthii]|uniref:Crotonyl-CoA carboxylase/reductase n=1 Tax=Actinophytocola xanthii TaxID=1912961 RepID=A0A1Q8CSR6_9PSEU|nr:crotonyl-CoA carboxylase/reductase [Actinophytocola xanthii]OLF17390.1 crotonyl-CoA carboxylase/reductase [Actinophytocola xanthii]